jgi:hypothetical protein
MGARLIIAGFVGATLCALHSTAQASPLDPRGEDWEGLSQFVRTAEAAIGAARVKTPTALDLDSLKPGDAVILVHPTRPFDPAELAAFMRVGGRVVLLDDYGTGDALLAHFGIRRVPMPAHPKAMLRGKPALAIAEPASLHAAVRDASHVVTNHATGLADTGLLPLLVVAAEGEPNGLLAVAGVVGKGRLIVVGDASIAMNAMLRYPGNRAFADALIRYVTEASAADDREGQLYVVAGDSPLSGAFAGGPLPGSLREVRDALQRTLDTLKAGLPPFASYIVALAIGLGVVLWMSKRAGRTYKPTPVRFVRPTPLAAQGGVAGHAAVIASPRASRILAALELKSAIEEQLAARLGSDGPLRGDDLVAKARATGLLGPSDAIELSRILIALGRFQAKLLRKRGASLERMHGRQIVALAERACALLEGIDARGRGTVRAST